MTNIITVTNPPARQWILIASRLPRNQTLKYRWAYRKVTGMCSCVLRIKDRGGGSGRNGGEIVLWIDAMTTKASANLMGALKLGWPFRVVTNWGKRNNPHIYQSLDAGFLWEVGFLKWVMDKDQRETQLKTDNHQHFHLLGWCYMGRAPWNPLQLPKDKNFFSFIFMCPELADTLNYRRHSEINVYWMNA